MALKQIVGPVVTSALTFLLPHTFYFIMLAMHKNHTAHVYVFVCVCMLCVCVCVYVCACVFTSTHTHTRIHIHTHTGVINSIFYNFIISIL